MAERRVLTALRAAAIVIIATGLNDVLAGAVPRYEPLYAYLAAIAVVAFVDGVLLGALTALLSTAFYALLFLPRATALSPAVLTPLAYAFGTAVLAAALRAFVRSRRREPVPAIFAPSLPLLPPSPALAGQTEVLTAIDALREELREAIADAGRFRDAQGNVSTMESALRAARAEAEAYGAERERDRVRASELEQEVVAARGERDHARARAGELERELAQADGRVDGVASELSILLDATRAERDRAHGRLAELERELAQSRLLAQAEANEAVVALAAARDEAGSLAGRVAELELALSAAIRAQATLAEENETVRGALETERARREQLELDAAARENDHLRLRARIDELEQELADASTAADDARSLRVVVAELEQALAAESAARAEAADLRRQAEEERERAGRAKAEFDEKLQTIVSHLAADHEADLGRAMEEREEARAEARSATMKLSVLQRKIDEERTAIAVRLRDADERHRRALDDAARAVADSRAAAQQEVNELRRRIAQLESTPHVAMPGKARILIVYPDAGLRLSARGVLERAGYEVVSAADGLEALRTAIVQQPDVVIADVVMPKMGGRELCQLLKSQEKTAGIRVILLTRAGDDPPRGDFPPDEVLRKPVPLETLKATLSALLD